MPNATTNLLAIEVGSSRIKVGWFPAAGACASEKPAGNLSITAPLLPEPSEVFRVEHRQSEADWLGSVERQLVELDLPSTTTCIVAAVHQAAANRLGERVLQHRGFAALINLTREQIPIQANLKEPARVGIDRLLNAVAANRLRVADRPAIIVDMGTAMTVNLISPAGVLEGGAILAGPATALAALHSATSSLPLVGREVLDAPPPPVGKSTEEAIAAGTFWGAVGAARQLIQQMAATCDAAPEVFLTGGAARGLAPHVGLEDQPARYLPNLVLSGIRLTADRLASP